MPLAGFVDVLEKREERDWREERTRGEQRRRASAMEEKGGDVDDDGTLFTENSKSLFTVTIRLSQPVRFGISEFVPEIMRHGNHKL